MPIPLLGPIIIAAAGTAVGAFFQNRSAKIESERARKATEMTTAKELIIQTAKVMDDSVFRAKDFVTAMEHSSGKRSPEVEAAWQAHLTVREGWEPDKTSAMAGILLYFGPVSRCDLENAIDLMGSLHQALSKYYRDGKLEGAEPKHIKSLLATLRKISAGFNRRNLMLFQNESVGDFRNKQDDASYKCKKVTLIQCEEIAQMGFSDIDRLFTG